MTFWRELIGRGRAGLYGGAVADLVLPLAQVLAFVLGSAQASEPVSAEFLGYAPVDQAIRERIMRSDANFHLYAYLDDYFGFYSDSSLFGLLGTYSGNGVSNAFHNGEPNVVSMLLWHVALSGFSADLGSLCDSSNASYFGQMVAPEFLATVKPLCAWPAPAAQTDDVLRSYWLSLMSFNAPENEYLAWRDFFRGPYYAVAKPSAAVSAMAFAILVNPYFLLKR